MARLAPSSLATEPEAPSRLSTIPTVVVPIDRLKPHPRNYRTHPPDQLAHIIASIKQHGIYRNVVTAEDDTILAGHGVVKACGEIGIREIPVIRLPIAPDSPAALKLLAGDNEIGHLAEIDDRTFTSLLLDIKELDGLLGTGYDEAMLANLMFVTRGEIADQQEAEAWAAAGMPGDLNGALPFKLVISFLTQAERDRFVSQYDIRIIKRESVVWSARWPHRDADDHASLKFQPVTAE